jgi:predicted transcriptional regulator
MRFIRKCEFANILGVSKARVSQWLKAGVIVAEPNGMIDRIEAGQRLREYRNRPRKSFEQFDTRGLEEIDFGAMVSSFCKKAENKLRAPR